MVASTTWACHSVRSAMFGLTRRWPGSPGSCQGRAEWPVWTSITGRFGQYSIGPRQASNVGWHIFHHPGSRFIYMCPEPQAPTTLHFGRPALSNSPICSCLERKRSGPTSTPHQQAYLVGTSRSSTSTSRPCPCSTLCNTSGSSTQHNQSHDIWWWYPYTFTYSTSLFPSNIIDSNGNLLCSPPLVLHVFIISFILIAFEVLSTLPHSLTIHYN